MKKTFIAVAVTFGLTSHAFAACERVPYNAPEELQPACADSMVITSDGKDAPKDDARKSSGKPVANAKSKGPVSVRVSNYAKQLRRE